MNTKLIKINHIDVLIKQSENLKPVDINSLTKSVRCSGGNVTPFQSFL